MTENRRVFVVEVDDWAWVYVDGKLALSEHSVRLDHLLPLLGVNYEDYFLEGEWDDPTVLAMMENAPDDELDTFALLGLT